MTRHISRKHLMRSENDSIATPSSSPPSSKSFLDTINLWIYRYNLTTALYMLEPWERSVFNTIAFGLITYIVYGLYYSTLHPFFEKVATSYI